ncbi:MAG: N-acetylneuraminate synthase [Candidatus Thorarchaeota archaeon]|jgi:N-acetylneuraminate synthase
MAQKIQIGGLTIGEGEPVFIIAEAGVNHNGDIKLAKKLIDAAVDAGVDAVKFQTFKTENLTTRDAGMAKYQVDNIGETSSQYEMIQKLELSFEAFTELKQYCDSKDILFLSTPHTHDAMTFLDSLVPAFKIGSGDLTNLPFLRDLADLKKPLILSTGMSTLDEVQEAVSAVLDSGNKALILLHCVTNYPADIEDMNLKAMETLRNEFNLIVGFSDHSEGHVASVAAVALGALVLEKHFTLDKDLPGPDHKASLDPTQLKAYVTAIRKTEASLGDGVKKPAPCEVSIKEVARKSLVASTDIVAGTKIEESMVCIKRPGNGIAPKYLDRLVGKRAKVDITSDTLLTWEMFE